MSSVESHERGLNLRWDVVRWTSWIFEVERRGGIVGECERRVVNYSPRRHTTLRDKGRTSKGAGMDRKASTMRRGQEGGILGGKKALTEKVTD